MSTTAPPSQGDAVAGPPALHAASVGVFLRYLGRLRHQLDVAEAHALASGRAPQSLLEARLAPDMLPLAGQVRTAAHFSLRTAFPIAGRPVPPACASPQTFDGLREALRDAEARLLGLPAADFDDAFAAGRLIESTAGEAQLRLPAAAFLHAYAMPNFFFHLGMAYAVMRQQGVPLGKADFDGWHAYPPVR